MSLVGWFRRQSRLGDLSLALVVGGVSLAAFYALRPDAAPARDEGLGPMLLLTGAVTLFVHRSHPRTTMTVTTALVVIMLALDVVRGPYVLLPVMIALYAGAAERERTWAIASGATVIAVSIGRGLIDGAGAIGANAPALLSAPGWIVAAVVAGEVTRNRRSYMRESEARALEQERTRIARELHDVLAHHVSMINVRAGVAVHLLPRQPEEAESALVAIRDASKEALQELRAILGVLRDVDNHEDPAVVAPGLGGLDDLIARARATGLAVEVEVTGTPRQLPDPVDRTAYRIVQESLTNVARHAGPATAEVRIGYESTDLVIAISDDGRGRPDDAPRTPGSGIKGMGERVTEVGGHFEAGPDAVRGFRVYATFPLDSHP